MSMNLSEIKSTGGPKQKPLEAGAYPCRIVTLAVIGMHSAEFKGDKKEPRPNLVITYELLDEFVIDEDGKEDPTKPRWQSETISLNPLDNDRAISTIRYNALDPSHEHGGDFSKLIGMPCIVNIQIKTSKSSGKPYNKVGAVSLMRDKEAKKAPPLVNDQVVFDFYEPTKEAFEELPNWVKNDIRKAEDYVQFDFEDDEEPTEKDENGKEEEVSEKEDW